MVMLEMTNVLAERAILAFKRQAAATVEDAIANGDVLEATV